MATVDAPALDQGERAADGRVALGRRVMGNRWIARLLVWGSLILLWEITARVKGSLFLPTPYATLRGLGKLASEGHLPTIANSLRQLFSGYLFAVLVGVPLGLLMGSIRAVDDFFAPYVNTLFIVSKEALLPFLIILFGTRFTFRVTVVFLFSIFFIVMNTASGVRSVDPRLIETARAFRVPMWQIFAKVVVPGSLPFVIAGLRLGLSTAIKGMVIAEIWVTVGIGLLLKNFGVFLRLDLFFALAIVIIAIGLISTSLLKMLENRLRPWTRAAA
jgi:ABC-type nitrate/sulfonate/bicarbonate transport system permease component